MKIRFLTLFLAAVFAGSVQGAGGSEYTGQFFPELTANVEDSERVVFKEDAGERLKSAGPFDANTHITIGKLLDPRTQQFSILAFLVEGKGTNPVIYLDTDDDHMIAADEKFVLSRNADDTYLWSVTAALKIKDGLFKTCPIFIRYFKSYKTDKMTKEERLLTQTTEVFARGKVNVKGKDILFQYSYSPKNKKIDPQSGWLGVDADGDGDVDMDGLSPEAAKADDETVVFRVGDLYVSTKKVDVSKNQIVVREQESKDYKRSELYLKKEFPDFSFTDFDGKKHKFSEYRGKYVLLDVWGLWCGPCRRELPYIREASRRFESRNLQIVGLNTDPDYTVDSMRKSLKNNQMTWTQAQFESVADFLSINLRVNSFPTTFLISPEGKILSMSRSERDEPSLRGEDLLTTLDEILPN